MILLSIGPKTVSALLGGFLLVLVGSVWRVWTHGKRCATDSGEDDADPSPQDCCQPPLAGEEPTHPESDGPKTKAVKSEVRPGPTKRKLVEYPILLGKILERCSGPEVRSFLEDIAIRVRDEGPGFDSETPFDFVEEIVDRIDELKSLRANQPEAEAARVDQFIGTLVGMLADCGVELLHSDEWNPAIQRAISKEPAPGIAEQTITGFGSTGISRHQKLLRKQEVSLAVPKPTQNT